MVDGNPRFSNKREPGSSAGNSAIEGTEAERGRLGRGFCKDVDLEHALVLGTGERKRPLNVVCRVVAAPTTAALYWGVTGLQTCCLSSDGRMIRFAGRRFSIFRVV